MKLIGRFAVAAVIAVIWSVTLFRETNAKDEAAFRLEIDGKLVVLLKRGDDRIMRLAEKAIRHEMWERQNVAAGFLQPRSSADIDKDAASILDEHHWRLNDTVIVDPEPDSRKHVLEWQEWAQRNLLMKPHKDGDGKRPTSGGIKEEPPERGDRP